jgi:hypothetical protein
MKTIYKIIIGIIIVYIIFNSLMLYHKTKLSADLGRTGELSDTMYDILDKTSAIALVIDIPILYVLSLII